MELASSSFGQTFETTAIQMLTAVNTIANGGKMMKPYVVSSVLDEEGNTISHHTAHSEAPGYFRKERG